MLANTTPFQAQSGRAFYTTNAAVDASMSHGHDRVWLNERTKRKTEVSRPLAAPEAVARPLNQKRREYSKSVLRLPSGGGNTMRLPALVRQRSTRWLPNSFFMT